MRSCEEVRGELVALLDGEVETSRAFELRAHLSHCTDCARELSELERVRGFLAEGLVDDLSETSTGFDDVLSRAQGEERPTGPIRGGLIDAPGWGALAAGLLLVISLGYALGTGSEPRATVVASRGVTASPVRSGKAGPEVPPRLRDSPDMFVDFVIVRRLEKLRQLPRLLAAPAPPGASPGHGLQEG